MLYLMLVVVFTKLSKKWWLFLMLGWGIVIVVCHLAQRDHVFVFTSMLFNYAGLPVIVVGIAAGVQYENYGHPDRGLLVKLIIIMGHNLL